MKPGEPCRVVLNPINSFQFTVLDICDHKVEFSIALSQHTFLLLSFFSGRHRSWQWWIYYLPLKTYHLPHFNLLSVTWLLPILNLLSAHLNIPANKFQFTISAIFVDKAEILFLPIYTYHLSSFNLLSVTLVIIRWNLLSAHINIPSNSFHFTLWDIGPDNAEFTICPLKHTIYLISI